MNELIEKRIQESIAVKSNLLNNPEYIRNVDFLSDMLCNAFHAGNKMIICGNGGSASDALHFAGEIIGRFQEERTPWPAIVLNSDVSSMTAISNDYGYDEVFARQAKAHAKKGDVFIGISTSGNSENVYRAINTAKNNGAQTVALLGADGGKVKDSVDLAIKIPSVITARIQECHILTIHILCELIENKMKKNDTRFQI